MFTHNKMGLTYVQVGQENGFDWENEVKRGLPAQMEFVRTKVESGLVQLMTLGEMGRMFKNQYQQTPPMAVAALSDWAGMENQSVWYNSKNFRINIFRNNKCVWIRDIHKFDERYRDVYLDHPCTEKSASYETLPVVDGLRFSNDEVKAGIYLGDGRIVGAKEVEGKYKVDIELANNKISMLLSDNSIEIVGKTEFEILFKYKDNCEDINCIAKDSISYNHNGFEYTLQITKGFLANNIIKSEDHIITFIID